MCHEIHPKFFIFCFVFVRFIGAKISIVDISDWEFMRSFYHLSLDLLNRHCGNRIIGSVPVKHLWKIRAKLTVAALPQNTTVIKCVHWFWDKLYPCCHCMKLDHNAESFGTQNRLSTLISIDLFILQQKVVRLQMITTKSLPWISR